MGVYTIYYTPIWYTSMRYLRVLHKKNTANFFAAFFVRHDFIWLCHNKWLIFDEK